MTAPRAAGADSGRVLLLRNAQRDCAVNLRFLRQALRHVLETELGVVRYELAVHLVTARAMAEANAAHLGHEGPTDVITFDYAERPSTLHGELLICPAVARVQARQFRTTWMSEVIRYAVHGILHLRGYDDQAAQARRRMKREEDRLLEALARPYNLARVRRSKRALSVDPQGSRLRL